MSVQVAYDVRPYRDDDLEAVLRLLSEAMGGGPTGRRTEEFFRWKHLENPFGRSAMLLGVAGERVIGLRAFMRWTFETPDGSVPAVRAVDTATHPDFQGRGVFTRLTLAALEELRQEVAFVFNTPNEKSLPGYLKMGWRVAGRLPVRVIVRRPLRGALSLLGRPAGARVEATDVGAPVDQALPRAAALAGALPPVTAFRTPRTEPYLRWRYARPPNLTYRALENHDGLAIFRIRARRGLREATAAEVLDGPSPRTRRLLHATGRAVGADHVSALRTWAPTPGLRVPGSPVLAVHPLDLDPGLDPLDLRSWAVSLGDMELF